MIARRIGTIMLMMLYPAIAHGQQLAPLALGGAPPCPEHNGIREFHSAVARDGGVSAFIVGIARRNGQDATGLLKYIWNNHRAKNVWLFRMPIETTSKSSTSHQMDGSFSSRRKVMKSIPTSSIGMFRSHRCRRRPARCAGKTCGTCSAGKTAMRRWNLKASMRTASW